MAEVKAFKALRFNTDKAGKIDELVCPPYDIISEEQRKERNIVFHSLRHYCATQIAQRASLEIAMKILGHRTEEMTRLYSEHETQMKLNNAKEVLAQGWKLLTA